MDNAESKPDMQNMYGVDKYGSRDDTYSISGISTGKVLHPVTVPVHSRSAETHKAALVLLLFSEKSPLPWRLRSELP